jgi:uncharacterized protein Usg
VAGFVTAGAGFTVTVIVYGTPTHPPVVAVGVTIYCTDPAVALLGVVSVWLIVDPLPADDPVIPPEIVPIVQVNVLATLAVNEILGFVPLQVAAVAGFVTTGFGLTVITIEYGAPAHDPVDDVGVTRYSIDPAVVVLGFVRVWFNVVPDPALAPVIAPVLVPIVHVNVLATDAVKVVFGLVPLQMDEVAEFVTAGVGLTVTVIV